MLSQEEIQKMFKEMGLDDLDERLRLAEYEKWTKLASGKNDVQLQTFIEITTTTMTEDEQGSEHGKLGRHPK